MEVTCLAQQCFTRTLALPQQGTRQPAACPSTAGGGLPALPSCSACSFPTCCQTSTAPGAGPCSGPSLYVCPPSCAGAAFRGRCRCSMAKQLLEVASNMAAFRVQLSAPTEQPRKAASARGVTEWEQRVARGILHT